MCLKSAVFPVYEAYEYIYYHYSNEDFSLYNNMNNLTLIFGKGIYLRDIYFMIQRFLSSFLLNAMLVKSNVSFLTRV